MDLEKFFSALWKYDEKSNTQTAGIIQKYLKENNVPITFINFKGMFRGIPAFCNKDGVFLNNEVFGYLGSSMLPTTLGIYILIHEIQHYKQYIENPIAFYAGADADFETFNNTVDGLEKDADDKTVNVMRVLKLPGATVPEHGGETAGIVMKKIQELYKNNRDKYPTFGDAQYDVVVNGTSLGGLNEMRNFVRRAIR